MTQQLSLRGLQAVEAAARSGSFAAAATELAVSPAAISQLIRAIEEQFGRQLFRRINRRVVLTEAGREILPRLSTAFEELRSVSRELGGAGSERRARLVVSVPPSLAMGWLSTRLVDFIRQHGLVDIALRGEEDPVAFERDRIDLRFTYGRLHDREHDTLDICRDAVYPVCAPDYLAAHGRLQTADKLRAATLIHTDWGPAAAAFPSWHGWFASGGITPGRDIQHGVSANSSRAALDLAISGLGVALGQGIYIADALKAGTLVMPLPQRLELAQPYCLALPQRSQGRPVVTAFKDWLVAACRDAVETAAGTAQRRRSKRP
jgi:LysR family glycine cleavage system transcriptional activator